MAFIIWRTIENKKTKYFAWEAHLIVDKLSLCATILKTRHLVENLSKQPCVGKLIHYQQCLPHPMKVEETGKYFVEATNYTHQGRGKVF
jgi:hypothetical protein